MMIWFSCKQCGKVQGRPENSAGTLIFCDCGQGNTVPWESTASEPEAPLPVAVPALPTGPKLEPLSFDPGTSPPPLPSTPAPRARSRRRPQRYRPDPNYCLNHEGVPSQKTCAACEEAFCNDCIALFQGVNTCGPCKNFQLRALQKPPRISGLALSSLVLALLTGPWVLGLIGTGNFILCLLALIACGSALVLGIAGLKVIEKTRLGGRSLALTGILAAAGIGLLAVVLTFFAPGIWG
jgi:hypothetical protein